MLRGKKILLGITGSIAAYKSVFFLRLLIKAGAEVKVVMTSHAADFVNPLTFSTLSKKPALTDLTEGDVWANHVELGRWADVMIIAPASCNTMAKMANGLCDNLLMAIYLSAVCPVIVFPAMDEDMWLHPATKSNIATLENHHVQVVSVNNGELASGLFGEGRMQEPEEMLHLIDHFFAVKNSLSGKKVLITAGPTYEEIDPVRFIGNHSTGKMGISIAEEFAKRGAEVTLILGPSAIIPKGRIKVVKVVSADEMYDETIKEIELADYIIMAAAVADYTPVTKALEKIKKTNAPLKLDLIQTKDILLEAGKRKLNGQILVGFALETENEKHHAIEKLRRKNADFIVLNSLKDEGAGFAHKTNKITIFGKEGEIHEFDLKLKEDVAIDIINAITKGKND
ncbi:MAG: bifunctional phosphopantothenoylcysteine decarboxylase/phosphopantothenate--cysteine ligase CoaBC [Ginsengibacter sp.]